MGIVNGLTFTDGSVVAENVGIFVFHEGNNLAIQYQDGAVSVALGAVDNTVAGQVVRSHLVSPFRTSPATPGRCGLAESPPFSARQGRRCSWGLGITCLACGTIQPRHGGTGPPHQKRRS